jgi:hypothetical protein
MTAADCRITRRSFFVSAATFLIYAPAIVRVESLMPVRNLPSQILNPLGEFYRRCYYHSLDYELRTGQLTANINGKIVSVADARQMVAVARAKGWLAKPAEHSQIHRFRRCARQSQGISKLPEQGRSHS